jgi:uncharacterized protein YndB with AHSA1/START domain
VEIRAPVERVFRALTEPEQIVQWWGSRETYQVTAWHADLRVGGTWDCEGVSPSGGRFTVRGEFRVVDAPRRLVHTWQSSWRPTLVTMVEYQLDQVGEVTVVRVRHSGFAGDVSARDDMLNGLPSVLSWLRRFLLGAHSLN